MKLSNKLLIGLGIALFAIPMPVISYMAGQNRMDSTVYNELLKEEGENPNSKDTFLKSFPVDAFEKLTISNLETSKNPASIHIHLVPSDRYAVKVAKKDEEKLTISKGGEGELSIKLQDYNHYISVPIYIFTPNLAQLKLSNVQVNEFFAKQESLLVEGDQLSGFSMHPDIAIENLSFVLKNSTVQFFEIGQEESASMAISNLIFELDSSNVGFPKANFNQVQLNLRDSKFNFNGGAEKDRLKRLTLNTLGNCEVGMRFDGIDHLQGHLSEQTITDFPLVTLRQLLK